MKWIKVSDKLPKTDKDVLVCFIGWDDRKFQKVLNLCPELGKFYDGDGLEHENVIAWQELPSIKEL